jgi:hypothetical protein
MLKMGEVEKFLPFLFGQFNFFSYLYTTIRNNRRLNMKITDLKEFRFDIGNTTNENGGFLAEVVATNSGILENDKLVATYEEDANIESVDDLEDIIEDAIWHCPFKQEDCEGLCELVYNDASLAIDAWWEENYG